MTRAADPVLQRARAGEGDAISELYVSCRGAVYAVAYRLTGCSADAEDVLHDVFLALPQALESFEGRGSFEGWIRKVAARTALMRMRRQRRRAIPIFGEPLWRSPVSEPTVRLTIEDGLVRLRDDLRAVFVLKEVEGYSHDEIAALLGISPGASRTRLNRARKWLRKFLGEWP